MDKIFEIQIGTGKTVNSVNQDTYITLPFKTNPSEILPYDETSVINLAQLFDDERQASSVFRIYGSVDFFSIVNGLKKNYTKLTDFYMRPRIGQELLGTTRNILNTFDVYLCKQWTGNTYISGSSSYFQRKYEVLTNLNSCELYFAGYTKNIFYDQIFGFDFNLDIDVSDQFDSFGKPIMNLYLLFNFKPSGSESVRKKIFDSGSTETINKTGVTTYQIYNAGDIIDGDLVYYNRNQFEEVLVNEQEYYVRMPCSVDNSYFEFKYFPFIPIKLRDFSDEIVLGNITGTSEVDFNIPDYAVSIDNHGNYVWKNILPYGYIDPESNRGVSFPFTNKRHYIFSNIKLPLQANLDNEITANNFNNIVFGPQKLIAVVPTDKLNNLGKKC